MLERKHKTQALSVLLIWLLLLLSGKALAQEMPGGSLSVRPAHSSERGHHPKIVVQTVPDATTTATCLVIRYREPGKKGPTPGTAHVLEHLLFRSRPGGRPGQLLLRNETNGGQSKAWVTAEEIVFSEEVPADDGLQSLALQLDRLTAPPKDREGLMLEQQAIRNEIRSARTPEEQGRRELLRRLGHPTRPEGSWEEVKGAKPERLLNLLEQLNLENDVVIAVVGPHPAREVRQFLSKNLKQLACKRVEAREDLKPVETPLSKLEAESPSNISQTSSFYKHSTRDPRLIELANEVLAEQVEGAKLRLARESNGLFRLDQSPANASLQSVFEDLTPQQSQAVLHRLQQGWLKRYESAQRRAEMIALTSLRNEQLETNIRPEEFPELVKAAKSLIQDSRQPLATLTLKPVSNQERPALFPFRMLANREAQPSIKSERLPNQLGVTLQRSESWPVVALSGFFRISPGLEPGPMSQLQKTLNSRKDLMLDYEVKPNGLFFHTWAPASELKQVLKSAALELQTLSKLDNLLADSPSFKGSPIDIFFLSQHVHDPTKTLKGSKLINPRDGHLVVIGDLDDTALDEGLRPDWSGWFGKSTPPSLRPKPPVTSTEKTKAASKTIEIRAKAQPVLLVGFWGPSRSSPNFLAFNLALQSLAGRPATSIMARRLKPKFSEVSSIKLFPLSASVGDGRQLWIVALQLSQPIEKVDSLVTKVKSMLKSLAERPLPKSELDRTRAYLKSSLVMSGASMSGRAKLLAHAEFYRLSKNYANDFAGLYDNLTPSLVQAVCKPFLLDADPRWLYLKPKGE